MKWALKMEALIEKVICLAVMLASLNIEGFIDGKALGWLDECDVGQSGGAAKGNEVGIEDGSIDSKGTLLGWDVGQSRHQRIHRQ